MIEEATEAALKASEERRELFRIAAQRIVDNQAAGRIVDPHAVAWAKQIVTRIKPLGRPLSDGSLARACVWEAA